MSKSAANRTIERAHRPSSEPVGNWLWLVEPPGAKRMLVLGPATTPPPKYAAAWFEETLNHPIEPGSAPTTKGGRLTTLPFDANSFDCVSIPGTWATVWEHLGRSHARVASECARILRPEGQLHLTDWNPLWQGFLVGRKAADRALPRPVLSSVLRRRFREAGFQDVRTYYVEPSQHQPRFVIPSDHVTASAYEDIRPSSTLVRAVRKAIFRWGPRDLLYPAVMHIARR